MSLRVTLSVDSLEFLDRVAGSVENRVELNARIAGDAEDYLKRVGKQIAAGQHRTANTLGATPTGHLGEAYEGIESSSGADKAEVLIPRATRLRAAFGTYVLTPKNAKFLTIPVHREAYGKRAREIEDLFALRTGPKKTLVLARRVDTEPSPSRQLAGRARPTVRRRQRSFTGGIEVMYVLVKSATIPGDETLIPFDDLTAEARDSAEAYLDEVVADAIRGSSGGSGGQI